MWWQEATPCACERDNVMRAFVGSGREERRKGEGRKREGRRGRGEASDAQAQTPIICLCQGLPRYRTQHQHFGQDHRHPPGTGQHGAVIFKFVGLGWSQSVPSCRSEWHCGHIIGARYDVFRDPWLRCQLDSGKRPQSVTCQAVQRCMSQPCFGEGVNRVDSGVVSPTHSRKARHQQFTKSACGKHYVALVSIAYRQ